VVALATIRARNGRTFQVASSAAPKFQALLDQLPPNFQFSSGDGGYNYRDIKNPTTGKDAGKLSRHALGLALDVGSQTNGRGTTGTTIPQATIDWAKQNGFVWGGDWSGAWRDPMHFQLGSGSAGSASPQRAATAPRGGADPISAALATIRTLETGSAAGVYQGPRSQNKYSSASGAYQFTDGTWRMAAGPILSKLYPKANMAPPDIQDRVATIHLNNILKANGGDITLTGVSWYTGKTGATARQLAQSGGVPNGPGNTGTVVQYRNKWVDTYNKLLGGGTSIGGAPASSSQVSPTTGTTIPTMPTPQFDPGFAQRLTQIGNATLNTFRTPNG